MGPDAVVSGTFGKTEVRQCGDVPMRQFVVATDLRFKKTSLADQVDASKGNTPIRFCQHNVFWSEMFP